MDNTGNAEAPGTALRYFQLTRVEEVKLLLPMAREWHAESRFCHIPFSEKKLLGRVASTLKRGGDALTIFAVYKGKPVGLIDLGVGEPLFCDGGRYATVLAFHVVRPMRRTFLGGRIALGLFENAKKWAKLKGAVELMVHGTDGETPRIIGSGEVLGTNIALSLSEA